MTDTTSMETPSLVEMESLKQRVADLEARGAEAETMYAVLQSLSTTLNLGEVIETILRELEKVVPYDSCSVQQIQGNDLVIVGGRGFANMSELLGLRFNPSGRDDPGNEVVRTRSPYIVPDVSERYAHFRNRVHGRGQIHGWMGVPLLFENRLIGMLTLDKFEKGFYTEAHARLAMAFAAQAATAIENARRFEETRQAKETAEVLRAANVALTQNLNLEMIFNTLLEYLCRLIPYDCVSLFIIEEGGVLAARAVEGYDQWIDPSIPLAVRFEYAAIPHINAVVTGQESLIIPDVDQFPGWVKVPSAAHVRNWLAVPLVANGKTIGLYSLDKTVPNFFTDEHRRMAETLAGQAAIAIQNALLFGSELTARQQAEKQTHQLTALNRVAQAATSLLDLENILSLAAREMVELLGARSAGVALLNAEKTAVEVVAYASKSDEPSSVGLVISLEGNTATQNVIKTRQSIVISDAQNTPLQDEATRQVMRDRNTHCIMITPLLARGEVIGSIAPDTDDPERVFTPEEVRLAETIASQMAGAIENARLFNEAQEAQAIAEAANVAKSDFLSNVSHELRTPLTSIIGFTKMTLKDLEERIFPNVVSEDRKVKRAISQASESLGIIVAEGERLTSLINNLLDLAKIEAGKLEWKSEPLRVDDVVERAVMATASLVSQKGLTLTREIEPGLPAVNGDRDRLIQVVINLISNAVKFTPQGLVICRAYREHDNLIVSVIDSGTGIAPEDQPKVFEKFKQVGDTLTDKPQGTGLGLPICKEIVEHHGGRLWLESEVGRGSTFLFSLPLPVAGTSAQE
jgi:signal transduction histidine kinase